MPLTEPQLSLRAQIAANARWSKENPAENAARGQAGLLAKFEREARKHEPGLTDAEYARRAESAPQGAHGPARVRQLQGPRRSQGRPR